MFLQKSRNLFLLTLVLCLLTGALCAFAEEEAALPESPVIRTAENAEIDTDCSELSSCSVTFRNTRAYTPEDFNTAKVVEKNYEPCEDDAGQDIYEYRYADDALLSITSDTSLYYGNRDADRYSQLLTYLDNAEIEPDQAVGEPYPLEEAQARCGQLFRRLHLNGLELDSAVPLSAAYIRTLTEEMSGYYRGAGKLAAFREFPEEIGGWYLTYRQELNGLKSAGQPQAAVVLTKSETALLELNQVIDHVNGEYEIEDEVSWVDAMRCFSANHCERSYADDHYSEAFEISRINLAYVFDFQGREGTDTLDARTYPCWYIEGHRAVTLTEGENVRQAGTKVIPFTEIYRISDGKKMLTAKAETKNK
jgi:hypothetical protein